MVTVPFWTPSDPNPTVHSTVPEIPEKLDLLQERRTSEPRYPGSSMPFHAGRTVSGVYVTPERAMCISTVWAAHRYIRETVGGLPAKAYRVERNGDMVEVSDHPVLNVLEWRPNPEMSPYQFRETLTGWAISYGNGVAEIERDSVGRVINLWPIQPERVRFLRDVETGELVYKISNGLDTQGTELRSSDVFHIRGYGDGPVGMSVFAFAAQSLGWARATELFGASFFGNGLHFGGTAILKQSSPDQEALDTIRERLNQTYRGPGGANGWFVGDGDMTITRTSATPDEAQFVTTMQHQVEEICRWMGVPPYKVHHLLRMTFNNVEQASIDAVSDSIMPWKRRFEQEATYKLFGLNRQRLKIVFDVTDLLRGDFKTMQEGFQVLRRNGVISADEWAERLTLPKPGKANGGDIYIVEKNMVPAQDVGKVEPSPAVPPVEPKPVPNAEVQRLLAEADALMGFEFEAA